MKFVFETDSPRGLSEALEHSINVLTTMGSEVLASHIIEVKTEVDLTIEKHLKVSFSKGLRYGLLDELAVAFSNAQEFSITDLKVSETMLISWLSELDDDPNDQPRVGVKDILTKVQQQMQALIALEDSEYKELRKN